MEAGLIAESTFSVFDWCIVGIYLAGTVVIGFWANRYIRNMDDYIVAGRSLGSSLGVATMLGSEIGLVTVMYFGQSGFKNGFAAFHIGLVAGIGCAFVGLTGIIVGPLRREGVKTIPEYYGKRFGPGVRVLGGIMMAAAGILNMGVFLKTGALFLAGLTNLNDPDIVNWIMAGLLALVLLYTTLGGMVSVVITDYVQFVVLSVGLVICCIFAVQHLGWELTVDDVNAFHGDKGVNPLDQEGFGVSYVIWSFFVFGLISCAVWPTAVMRACSVKDEKTVKKLYRWSAIGFVTRIVIPQFLGICALAFFLENDALGKMFFEADGTITADGDKTLQALPIFLSQILPVGLLGLVAAGMLAAFMSTNDSYLLCWAAVVVEDVFDPLSGNKLSTKNKLLIARILIVVIGLFLFVFGLVYPLNQNLVDYLAVSGAIYFTGAFAVLMFGLYWKGASRVGAYLALGAGSLAIFGLRPIQDAIGIPEGWLSEAQVGLGTTVTALVLMLVGSLLFPDRKILRGVTTDPDWSQSFDPMGEYDL